MGAQCTSCSQQQSLQLFTTSMPVKLNAGQLFRHAWVVKTIMASALLCRKNGRQRHWLGHRQADCISEAGFADALVQPYEIQHPLLFQKKKHVLLLLSTTLKQWQMGIAWSFRQTRARRSWKSANSKKNKSIGKAEWQMTSFTSRKCASNF